MRSTAADAALARHPRAARVTQATRSRRDVAVRRALGERQPRGYVSDAKSGCHRVFGRSRLPETQFGHLHTMSMWRKMLDQGPSTLRAQKSLDGAARRVDSSGIMRSYWPLLVLFGVCACTGPRHNTRGALLAGFTIPPHPSVLLVGVADAQTPGHDPAASTGASITAALRDQLIEHGVAVTVADASTSARPESRRAGGPLVLRGQFTLWEDNATEWSGNPDRATFSIELLDPATSQVVGVATHEVQASSTAWTALHPTRFIAELAGATLSRLFGWPYEVPQ